MIGFILAGGTGTRLWPKSRELYPKQFIDFTDSGESLLQKTLLRLKPLIQKEQNFIIGSENHKFELDNQLKEVIDGLPDRNILLEPMSRNTAPAILWGLSRIPEEMLNIPIVILPSDHLIGDENEFIDCLKSAQKLAEGEWVVTFGVKPTRPETGYGYIRVKNQLEIGFEVECFTEKPDKNKAKLFVDSGEYLWNAGIFMATGRVLLKEFQKHCPEMFSLFFPEGSASNGSLDIAELYQKAESISFDYAIMEKADRVAVCELNAGWNDLGSWESIYQVSPKDSKQNVTIGDVILKDSGKSMIFSSRRLVAGIGLENLIVIDTDDVLLICDMNHTQDIKQLVDMIKDKGRDEYRLGTLVYRPWGNYLSLFSGQNFQIKLIEVTPGKRISLQKHFHRSEHWIVLSGTAKVTKKDQEILLVENESTFI
ncbi:MAG: mannose-1-phosphate guanylyltransferase/mannose-6-phosphate isomerase, partial [Deltaproteobacteria bacterium]|nr:mannose-1-phosphate guanylyltransferase/mannose-6-phosphate isomerase [Deltaproteobacteria bacterium]